MMLGEGESSRQGFIVVEREILLEVEEFNILEGLVALIATYYVFHVNYPKSGPASGVLLFIQEVLMNMPAKHVRKPARYSSLVNSLL